VLNAGRIEQVGTPLELYRHPVNTFVAGFIANHTMNFVDVTPKGSTLTLPGGKTIATSNPQVAKAASLGVRPEHLGLTDAANAQFTGTIEVIEQFGEYALIHVLLADGNHLTVKLDGAPDLHLHTEVHVGLDPAVVHLFDADGRALRSA
jgi:multiple sugar transport system ATP-binding protein/alpha-glucoside transport system ATP-binding protein